MNHTRCCHVVSVDSAVAATAWPRLVLQHAAFEADGAMPGGVNEDGSALTDYGAWVAQGRVHEVVVSGAELSMGRWWIGVENGPKASKARSPAR